MIWGILKKLDMKELFTLLKLFFKYPLFFIPTGIATNKSIILATKNFKSTHHLHNPANAYRHALWNILIAKHCAKWSGNINKILQWTEIITTWHEDFSPNPPLERKMDLHNNAVGRAFFIQLKNSSIDEVDQFLLKKASEAIKISEESIDPLPLKQLVYIEDQ